MTTQPDVTTLVTRIMNLLLIPTNQTEWAFVELSRELTAALEEARRLEREECEEDCVEVALGLGALDVAMALRARGGKDE